MNVSRQVLRQVARQAAKAQARATEKAMRLAFLKAMRRDQFASFGPSVTHEWMYRSWRTEGEKERASNGVFG